MSRHINERKLQHIRVIQQDPDADRKKYYFDRIQLKHRALPEIDLAAVDPSTIFMGKTLSFPLLISSMTGGDHEVVKTINRNLAIAAEATGVAMGVGSQRVMFEVPAARSSFELRSVAPKALLFGNFGAVQLNNGYGLQQFEESVQALGADALMLHLNPLQEAVQPEGDTNFGNLAQKIAEVAEALSVPVVLKEVGAGFSPDDAELAIKSGVEYLVIAGTGGLSWSRIEHHRQDVEHADDLGLVFQDWGVPTPVALQQLAPYGDRLTFIASGGLRSGVDMAKAMGLGAKLCGLASPLLEPAMESSDAVIGVIEKLKGEFTTAMFLLGQRSVDELVGNEGLLL